MRSFGQDSEKVAVVYHHWPLYRLPVARLMCAQETPARQFTLFSDFITTPASIAGIDPALARTPVTEGGLRWRRLRNVWFGSTALWQVGAVRLAVAGEFGTIIYLGNMYYLSTWVSAAIARLRGKRVFYWTHGFRSRERGLKGRARKAFYSLAHGILLYGDEAKAIMASMGFETERLHVIYNSLDTGGQSVVRRQVDERRTAEIRSELFEDAEAPLLIFVGRLIASKKLEMVLEAAAGLADSGRPVNVLFVGDGPMTGELVRKGKALGLDDRLAFTGALYEESEIGPLFMAADLCVSPGFVGLTAMHSLAYGTPVVTHDNSATQSPEYEAVIDGVTGALFKENDVCDLTRVLGDWLNRGTSRADLRRRCIDLIDERYTPQRQLDALNAALDRDARS